jgi:HD superfamily phosphohydrolase
VDRIDYLLRDSHHTGVAYGKFDHYRLIDELRILPSVEGPSEPALGINAGGIYSAEALALARYFMFSQVYYHPIRLIYDHHLKDFLSSWLATGTLLKEGTFPIDVESHLRMTDDEVNAAVRRVASDPSAVGHHPASCIMRHKHFKLLYEKNQQDVKVHSSPGDAIAKAAQLKFGGEVVRYSKPKVKNAGLDFPVRGRDNRIQTGISASPTLSKLQPTSMEFVFIDPRLESQATEWLESNRDAILLAAQQKEQEEEHEA